MKDKTQKKYFYGFGRHKSAVAAVRLYPGGTGKIKVNRKRPTLERELFIAPLKITKLAGNFDISALARGGGITSQAKAIRLGIARALLAFDSGLRAQLKKHKFLTRDARVKERKKPGLKRARRAPQWAKR